MSAGLNLQLQLTHRKYKYLNEYSIWAKSSPIVDLIVEKARKKSKETQPSESVII